MNINDIKKDIESDLKIAKAYEEFIRSQIDPLFTPSYPNHYDHLHFFNLGYKFAMEKIFDLLKKVDDTQSTMCPKCSNVRVKDGLCWNMGCDYKLQNDKEDPCFLSTAALFNFLWHGRYS